MKSEANNQPHEPVEEFIHDLRLVSAYLRSAIVEKSPVFIKLGELAASGTILDLSEAAARDKDGKRLITIFIERDLGIPNGTDEVDFVLTIPLRRMALQILCRFKAANAKVVTLEVPSDARIIRKRSAHRLIARDLNPRVCAIQVSRGDRTYLGLIEVMDISTDGFGGKVMLSSEQTVRLGDEISGQLRQKHGSIPLNGRVVRCEEVSVSGKDVFFVGIQTERALRHSSSEQRNFARVPFQLPIEFVSPLSPKARPFLRIKDLSYSGFSAEIINPADRELFRLDMELETVSPKLRLKVVGLGPKNASFRLVHAQLEERIHLFNLVTSACEPRVVFETPFLGDIAELFATSGAVSSVLATKLAEYSVEPGGLGTPDQSSSWQLRWMEIDQSGSVNASVTTAPYADNLWYLGGFAGHLDPSKKMSAGFVGRYFLALADFLKSLGQEHTVAFNWLKSHSWWKEWEDYLAKRPFDSNFFRLDGSLAFLRKNSIPSWNSSSKWIQVTASHLGICEDFRRDIRSEALLRYIDKVGSLGADVGSASISALLSRCGHYFFRKSYVRESETYKALTVVSGYPDHSIFHGVLNFPNLVVLGRPTSENIDELCCEAIALAASNGVFCQSVLLFVDNDLPHIGPTKSFDFKQVIWTIGSPDVFDFWRRA